MSNSKHSVLLIEDNPLNMELVTDLLESSGLDVWQACSAEEGLTQARKLPELIIMDLSLPGMDGLEAVRLLRSNSAVNYLPVIALTAHAMKGDEAIAISAGFDGYLTKPIDTRTFAKTILSFIEASLSRQQILPDTTSTVCETFNPHGQRARA